MIINVQADKSVSQDSSFLCNQYDNESASITINLPALFINAGYSYFIICKPPKDSGVNQYSIPLILNVDKLSFIVNSTLSQYMGNWQFCVVVKDTLGELVVVTEYWVGKVLSGIAEQDLLAAQLEESNLKLIYDSYLEAEALRVISEDARKSNETTRESNETARETDETERNNAEIIRISNENGRITAENNRVVAETNRSNEETDRVNEEAARVLAETARANAETTRQQNETTRQNNESTRQTNETNRTNAESARVTAEQGRVTAEGNRVTSENNRVAAENARASIGAYNAATAYVIGNKVTYNGSTYQCILASTGNLPTNATYWILIAQKGDNTTAASVALVDAGGKYNATDVEAGFAEIASSLDTLTTQQWTTEKYADGSVTPEKTSFIEKTTFPQLFDTDNFVYNNVQLATTVNVSTPDDFITVTNFAVTNTIDCDPNVDKTFATNIPATGVGFTVFGYYLKDGIWVRRKSATLTTVNGHTEFTFVASDAIGKIRMFYAPILFSDTPILTYQSEYSADATVYHPAPIHTFKGIEIQNNSPYYNKKIAGIGDSIMIGYDQKGGFLSILKEKYPLTTITNLGVGSTTIARNNDVPANATNKCIYDRIDDLPSDVDYVFLEGGLNDYYHKNTYSVVFGSYIENIDKSPISARYTTFYDFHERLYIYGTGDYVMLDVTTFCGAFEASLIKLITRYYNKKYGVIIPHNPNGTSELGAYLDVEVALCAKYGVPCLDLRKVAGMPRIYAVAANADGTSYYTADAVHPNTAGYTDRYLPAIEAWMKTL